jgi:hypothetical protein
MQHKVNLLDAATAFYRNDFRYHAQSINVTKLEPMEKINNRKYPFPKNKKKEEGVANANEKVQLGSKIVCFPKNNNLGTLRITQQFWCIPSWGFPYRDFTSNHFLAQ